MAKLTLTDLVAKFSSITAINANNDLIEAAIENTLSRDGTAPNAMAADLDMDSNAIINLPAATGATEPVRKGDIATDIQTAGVQSQGAWTTATAYAVNNLVTNGGSSYIATSAHTSGASTEPGVGGSWETVWIVAADKGDTGDTGPAGNDGIFDGTEATVSPAASDKIAILDISDSDNPKYVLFSDFGGGATAPTRTSQSLTGASVDVAIPSGCTQLIFKSDSDIVVSAAGASVQCRLVSSSTEETYTGINDVSGTVSQANAVLAFAIAPATSGTDRRVFGQVFAVRQARSSITRGVGWGGGTTANKRDLLTDGASDYDTLRFVTSTGTFTSGTIEIEFYYN